MQVSKWGNSLAVRLPAALVRELGVEEGDTVTLVPARARRRRSGTEVTLEVQRQPSREELIDGLRFLRWRAPPDFKFDREEANERGGSW